MSALKWGVLCNALYFRADELCVNLRFLYRRRISPPQIKMIGK